MVKVLNISHCPLLRLAESMAFAKLPTIQTLVLSNNPNLTFVSESAFGVRNTTSTSLIFEFVLYLYFPILIK